MVMKNRLTTLFTAISMALTFTACENKNKSDGYVQSTFNTKARTEIKQNTEEEITEEPTTLHVSPVETISAEVGTQYTVDKVIPKTDGKNTIKIPRRNL